MSDEKHFLVIDHQQGGTLMHVEHPESCAADQLACAVTLATASYGGLQGALGPEAATEDLASGRYEIEPGEEGALSLKPA